jgi:hypothetical protein
VKLAGDPNKPARTAGCASIEELRPEVQKHPKILAPVLNLEALTAPGEGITNRDMPQGRAGNDASAPHE